MIIWFPEWNFIQKLLFNIHKEKRIYSNDNMFEGLDRKYFLSDKIDDEFRDYVRKFYRHKFKLVYKRII